MNRSFHYSLLFLAALALGLGACSNPADGTSQAEVGEAAPAAGAPAMGEGEIYDLTDATTIGFVGSKVTGSHDGGFKSFDGTITLVDDDPTKSHVELTIDADSLWADNEKLTGHLKSPDFFDVATFPEVRFESTAITATPDGYQVTGNLDLHGVTKSITFPATINVAEDAVTAQAEFHIKRFDFGIEYPGKADDLIRDEVVIKLDLVAQPEA